MVSAKKMLIGLAVGALLSLPASGLAEIRCGSTITSACASVSAMINADGDLVIRVSNISTGDASNSVLTKLLLKLRDPTGVRLVSVMGTRGGVPNIDLLSMYRISTSGRPPNVGSGGWNVEIEPGSVNDRDSFSSSGVCKGIINSSVASSLPCGQNGDFYDEITFTIGFDGIQDQELLAWAFQAQNLYDGGSDWTTDSTVIPEPITLILLGSGLVGVGLARRRKKYGEDPEDL